MAAAEPPPIQKARRVNLALLLAALVLVPLNMLLGYAHAFAVSHDAADATGSALFSLSCPLIVAGFFSIGKRFRSLASWTQIIFWTSVVVLLGKIGQFAQASDLAR